MREKTVGYIVEGPKGAYSLADGTLWLNGPATLFKTRPQAKTALKRTTQHVSAHYWTEWLSKSYVRRVAAAPSPEQK